MNKYKEDPQQALAALEKIAEEIPSGVSAQDVGEIVTKIKNYPDEITENLKQNIATELKTNLKEFWILQNVEEKLKNVEKLQNQETEAIRLGMSHKESTNAAKAEYLNEMKKILEGKLKYVRQENCTLESNLKTKSDIIKKQIYSINSYEFAN